MGEGIVCLYDWSGQTLLVIIENYRHSMTAQWLLQLLLKEMSCESIENGLQGTVHWQNKYHYPGRDGA